MINPYVALGALALLTASAVGSFWFGYDYGKSDRAEDDNEQLRILNKAYTEAFERNNKLAQELEDAKKDRKVIYRDIEKSVIRYVDRPVYKSACIDVDGLRDANAAIRGQAADPGKPEAAVPAPD